MYFYLLAQFSRKEQLLKKVLTLFAYDNTCCKVFNQIFLEGEKR
jgi:hypothetical protein